MKLTLQKSVTAVFTIVIFSTVLLLILGSTSSNPNNLPAYFLANQYYQAGNYQESLQGFFNALRHNPNLIHKEPLVRFKIGYGFYQTGEYQKSLDVFENSRKSLGIIEDYLLFYESLCYLKLEDTARAMLISKNLRNQYPESPLIPLIDSLQASLAMHFQQPDSAVRYLISMMRSNHFDKDRIYLDLIEIHYRQQDTLSYRQFIYDFLKKYPFHDRSESLFTLLSQTYQGKIPLTDVEKQFSYLFETKQFLSAQALYRQQEVYAETRSEQEYYRWIPIEINYRQGEYQEVLDWCLKERNSIKNYLVRREIDLTIPRCYLRLGNVDGSIETYLDFQKRYPRDKISPEVLWKVAWLYEGKNDLKMAIKMYRNLIKKYPRSSFFSEAYFRIGLDYFRLQDYNQARKSWEEASRREKGQSARARVMYWIGKCYEMQKDYRKQGEIFSELAKRPVESFYNLKAFYLTSNGKDDHRRIYEVFWELHQQNISYLPNYINKFQRALMVEEVLGSRWGDLELRTLNENSRGWQEIFALGELYERMQNYGFAYHRFRTVFNQNFSQSDIHEMVPIFKKLYPLYFTEEVDSSAKRFGIPPELIWSVMKKESAFAPKVISYANAYGLMQLLPGTASQIAPKLGIQFTSTAQLFYPSTNIQMGSYYLSSLLKKYNGNYIMALAGYNAGPHRVDRWIKRFPTYDDDLFMENLEFEQTRVYVRTCLKYFWIYRSIINPGEIPREIITYPIQLSSFL